MTIQLWTAALQLQRVGDFGSAGQGVGHSVHHERAAVTSVTGNIHRRGIHSDAANTRRKMRALGGHHRQRTTSSGNGHANGVEHTVLWARSLPGRLAPVTAAEAIRDTLYHILEERGGLA